MNQRYSDDDLDRAITLLNTLMVVERENQPQRRMIVSPHDATLLLRLIDDRSFSMMARERWEDLFRNVP